MAFLKWEDYLTLSVTTILTLGIGLYFALKGNSNNTTFNYLQGDGKMAVVPVALSFTVSLLSGITMLGVPTEIYMYGMQWCLSAVGWLISYILIIYVLIPVLKRLDITSIYEYLQRRFDSPGMRMFATIVGMLQMLNYLGFVLFTPAIGLQVVTNIPIWMSIIGVMTSIVAYTCIGGFKAVVWSDAFLFILMISGTFAVLIKGTIDAGGVTSVVTAIIENGRANFFDINLMEGITNCSPKFDPDPTLRQSFWSLVFGGVFYEIMTPFYQISFLRIKATPSVRTAQRMYGIGSLAFVFLTLLVVIQGAVMFAYYNHSGCDPIVSKQLLNPNQLLVEMLTRIFKDTPCLPGLFLAGLFSASLSTVSSVLSALSATFWEDIVRRHTKPMSEKRGILITKLSGILFADTVLMFGVLGTGVAFSVSLFQGPLIQINEMAQACLLTTVVGMFLLGLLDPLANKKGAVAGSIASISILLWISVGKITSSGVRRTPPLQPASTARCIFTNSSYTLYNEFDESVSNTTLHLNSTLTEAPIEPKGFDLLYSVSYKWLSAIGIITSLVTGSVVSRLQAPVPVDPSLVVPLYDLFCCCFRRPDKRKAPYGAKYPEIDRVSKVNSDYEAAENHILTEEPIDIEISKWSAECAV